MYAGKALPRIVERYGVNHRFRALPFTDHFSTMAFAKPAYRQCLRDIKAVLSAQSAKQWHMGEREDFTPERIWTSTCLTRCGRVSIAVNLPKAP